MQQAKLFIESIQQLTNSSVDPKKVEEIPAALKSLEGMFDCIKSLETGPSRSDVTDMVSQLKNAATSLKDWVDASVQSGEAFGDTFLCIKAYAQDQFQFEEGASVDVVGALYTGSLPGLPHKLTHEFLARCHLAGV